jgi:tripartite-type tricarboxylate transporter receptor subunit TctC
MRLRRQSVCTLANAAAALIAASAATAQTPPDGTAAFYAGKTVTFVSGSSPGGSYDVGSRLIARHLGRHIPGQPNVIVQNMPGAGSMAAANHLFNVAARDGSVIGMFGRGLYLDALFGAQGVRFDPRKFGWVGSHGREVATLVAGIGTPFKTLADAQAREMIVGTAPPGSDSHSFGVILNALAGTRLKMVSGYQGMAQAIMAIDRGEVHGNPGASVGTLMALRPDWLKEPGKASFLVQIAAEPHNKFLKGVPLVLDHARDAINREALTLIVSRMTMAYAFTAPPDLPPQRLQTLRSAFDAAVKDPAFLADATKMSADIDPVPGERIAAIIERAYASSPEVIARAKTAMASGEAK